MSPDVGRDVTGLRLTVAGREVRLRPGQSVVIGRDRHCDVTVTAEETSRRHARISGEEGWHLVDLGSANGTRVNGLPLAGSHRLDDGDLVHLGSADPAATVTIHVDRVVPATAPSAASSPSAADARTIGRAADCAVVVRDLNASRHHARLLRPAQTGQPWLLEDLGSFNGTFVNGQRVHRGALTAGDLFTVGSTTFELHEGGRLEDISAGDPPALVVSDLSVTLPSGERLLDSVSFSIRSSSLTAVIGPSGAGKSTLFKAMTGALTPSAGTVTYDGLDVHANLPSLRGRIGVVPQDDVLHSQLSVTRALSYAAELRFPPDVTAGARRERVEETMAALGLEGHGSTRIDRLSGGQRKRTSVALELLTRPALILLDEPTSGLDPGLDLALMTTLRSLARDGRMVLVITHTSENLAVCDDLLMLGPGGRVVYVGPPDELLASVGGERYAEAFRIVAEQPTDDRGAIRRGWHGLKMRTPGSDGVGAAPVGVVGLSSRPPVPSAAQARVRDQLGILVRRTARLVAADRSHLRFVALVPLVLAALALAVPGEAGFGPSATPTTESMRLLVVLVIGATFIGLSLSVRELVRERPIFERERAAGMSPLAQLLAKVSVLGAIAGVQAVAMGLVVLAVRPGPAASVGVMAPALELLVALATTAVVSVSVGLAVSSLVSTSEQVMPILVSLVMAQLVLCGGMLPVVDRAVLEQISVLAPARWGYAAAASVVDVDRVVGESGDWMWGHDLPTYGLDLLALVALGVLASVLVHRRIRVPDPVRNKGGEGS